MIFICASMSIKLECYMFSLVHKRLKMTTIFTVKRWLSSHLKCTCSLMSNIEECGYLAAFLYSDKDGDYGKSRPYKLYAFKQREWLW